MYPDTVVFGIAVNTTDDRGGNTITYIDGAPVKAYVETTITATKVSEPADAKPVTRTHYRILTKVDPSAGRGRTIQVNDRAKWTESANGTPNITLQLVSSPDPQGPQWLIQAERVT